ncbi:MAG: ATP-dependent Clp protease adaptor ClpS [Desulfatitalea sp.]|nr:ATP-dependent Clp protease adaptor ClpS [Desulfatitalea sp.]NNK01905.1 ATP-dependent Clp protease adaptor ClpS [Desulfatitalea sp.]
MAAQQPDIIEQVKENVQARIKKPRMYRVILHNDNFTTREFVVEVLVHVFHKGLAEATALMWQVHRQGSGVAGVYPRDVAETKVVATIKLARDNEFPLQVTMAPE